MPPKASRKRSASKTGSKRSSRNRERSPSPSDSSSSSSASNSSTTRRKRSSQKFPQKVPLMYAYEKIQEWGANYPDDITKIVNLADLEKIADDDHLTLVPLAKLKPVFQTFSIFQKFKAAFFQNIPLEYWEDVIKENPKKRPYVRKYSPSTRQRRKKLSLKAFVGEPVMSDVSDEDSVLSIDPRNDECDNTNVNFPKPLCQGIRKVCRYYDDKRRYKSYQDDHTQNRRYRFKLDYD